MDLLTHIASGLAISTTIAVCCNASTLKKTAIVAAGALGGALPDIDAISLWSKFDGTFGRLFGLQHSGKVIYSEKFWYSHHGFMHSLMACLLFAIILLGVIFLVKSRTKDFSKGTFIKTAKSSRLIILAFVGGYLAHLLLDMPTPGASWGGINLFFPFKHYSGGYGKIWWWNNYDIFLIINLVIVLNLVLLIVKSILKRNFIKISLGILLFASALVMVQISSRKFDFNYGVSTGKTYQQCEVKSKEIQQKILGKKLYNTMVKLDNAIPLHF